MKYEKEIATFKTWLKQAFKILVEKERLCSDLNKAKGYEQVCCHVLRKRQIQNHYLLKLKFWEVISFFKGQFNCVYISPLYTPFTHLLSIGVQRLLG